MFFQKLVKAEELKQLEELEERVKLLAELDSYKDPGGTPLPVYPVIKI